MVLSFVSVVGMLVPVVLFVYGVFVRLFTWLCVDRVGSSVFCGLSVDEIDACPSSAYYI